MPSKLSSASAYIPTPSTRSPPLSWPPTARRRHFCARVQHGKGEAKAKNRRRGYLQARRAVLVLGSILTLLRTKSPHRGPQSALQRTKQPRPTPPGASRGIIICSGPEKAPRSALCQHPTRHKTSGRTQYPLAFYLFSLD